MIRLGKLFNRKPTTRWSEKERKALKSITPLDPEDVDLVARFYNLEFPPDANDYRRTSLQTLLNNWNVELDRANIHFASHKS